MTKGTAPVLYSFRGYKCTVYEIAEALNITDTLVYKRIKEGIAPDDMKPNSGTYSSHIIEYNGKTQSITEWGRELGISDAVIRGRIKLGMTMDRVLSPEMQREKKHLYKGELKTAQEIADAMGKTRAQVNALIRNGKPLL